MTSKKYQKRGQLMPIFSQIFENNFYILIKFYFTKLLWRFAFLLLQQFLLCLRGFFIKNRKTQNFLKHRKISKT